MRCGNCGQEYPDESAFCPNCGTQNNQQNNQSNGYQQPNGYQQNQNNYQQPNGQYGYQNNMSMQEQGKGFAIASMVCGILSIVFCWCYGFVGLILGIVALAMNNQYKKTGDTSSEGMAKAGLVCGVIGAVLSAVVLVLWVIGCAIGSTSGTWFRYYL